MPNVSVLVAGEAAPAVLTHRDAVNHLRSAMRADAPASSKLWRCTDEDTGLQWSINQAANGSCEIQPITEKHHQPASAKAVVLPFKRRRIERLIASLIDLLDHADADPDLEPSLGWTNPDWRNGPVNPAGLDDREEDHDFELDILNLCEGDAAPSLNDCQQYANRS